MAYSKSNPPPLPPRSPGSAGADTVHLTLDTAGNSPYLNKHGASHPYSNAWASYDPRSSSTQSLVPEEQHKDDTRRTLLLIFVHGFMGDETSFQSFPVHLHNLLTVTVSSTHVVHTKLYPRYRSRRALEYATNDFSRWLTPHESPTTDVILLGHSMGGLLIAEVVLLSSYSPATGQAFRHRIVGTINFDTPFLGMHPGVIGSGLSSIFRSNPDPPGKAQTRSGAQSVLTSPSANRSQVGENESSQGYFTQSSTSGSGMSTPVRTDTLFSPKPSDPNFNPSFENDVILPMRKKWEGALHFFQKHSDGLLTASKQYVTSHIEFGGAMANYPALKERYKRIRIMEEEDPEIRRIFTAGPRAPPRVRFVNYYTASTGIPKKAKEVFVDEKTESMALDVEMRDMTLSAPSTREASRSRSRSPRVSLEEYQRDGSFHKHSRDLLGPEPDDYDQEMQHLDPRPMSEYSQHESLSDVASVSAITASAHLAATPEGHSVPNLRSELSGASNVSIIPSELSGLSPIPPNLPSIPPLPQEPPFFDAGQYSDKEARKQAEKEHSKVLKAYKQAIKNRDKALKERQKLDEKQRKADEKARKEAEKGQKEASRAKSGEEARLEAEAARMRQESERMQAEGQKREERERERLAAFHHETSKVTDRSTAASTAPPSYTQPPSYASHSPPPSSSRPASASPSKPRSPSVLQSSAVSSTTRLPSPLPSPSYQSRSHRPSIGDQPFKKPRDKKFCILPDKDPNTGARDPAWIRVFMEGVDEVGAHCGLFFVSETYERLLGDVAERVEGWLREAEDERVAREMGGE